MLLLLIATSCNDTPGGNDDDGALVVTFEQNASTGDAGELSEPPDLDIAHFVGQEYAVDVELEFRVR